MEAVDLEPGKDVWYRCADNNEKWYVIEPSPGVKLLFCEFCYAAIQLQIINRLREIKIWP